MALFLPTSPKERAAPPAFSVSGLQRQLRTLLEGRFRQVSVLGELSGFSVHPQSGHAYFTLKDQGAQLRCVMWRDRVRAAPKLSDGLEVTAEGKVTVYERGGILQMSVTKMTPLGAGQLELEYRKRVERLRSEGLFEAERKRPLPRFPRTIGVVTSASSAALRDVLQTLRRRDPSLRVVLAPAPVQGDAAPDALRDALLRLAAYPELDLILLVRGGGSLEDLWGFNDEALARTLAELPVPTVTGVGHETDSTLVDFVADQRASTPTAAAELAAPSAQDVRRTLQEHLRRLGQSLEGQRRRQAYRLLQLQSRVADPKLQIARHAQTLDRASYQLQEAVQGRVRQARVRLQGLEVRAGQRTPEAAVAHARLRLLKLQRRLMAQGDGRLEHGRRRLERAHQRLHDLGPEPTLHRGFALVYRGETLIRDASVLRGGDQLDLRLAKGSVRVVVSPQGSATGSTRSPR